LYNFGVTVDGSQLRYNGDYGAVLVTANAERITFEFYATYEGGTLIDTYTLP
jgi:hypothetical protein